MDNSINFLKQRQHDLTAAVASDRKYVIWMSYLLGAVIICALVVFAFDFFLQRSIGRVEVETATVETELRQHAEIESLYLQLTEKVSEIDKILTGRVEKRLVLQFFTTLFLTENLTLKEISFESAEVLKFTLVSSNVFTLDQALDQLESAEVRDRFASLSTTDLIRGETGEYSMKVSVGIKKLNEVPLEPVTSQTTLSQ